jgi:UDP-N-acetylmuramoyl-L-alanyl-D-glutamate--2,6-diaminopimelate ligase
VTPITLTQLIATLPDVIRVTGDAPITAPVVEASADLQPGGVFVARKGLSVDGHDFIPRAVEQGAAAVVVEREVGALPIPVVQVGSAQEATGYLAAAYHGYPSRRLTVIGVTGTDGKTTTSTLIHSILQVATQGRAGLISTVSAVIGDAHYDTGFHVTTPGAPQVQAFLAQMVERGLTHVVLEMTSHGLAQARLNGIDLDVAVLTNLTHEHLDYHGSFENYRAAKGRMFAMLGRSFRKPRRPKVAVINADDPNADFFAAFPADQVLTYGLRQGGYRAHDVVYRPDGITFIAEGAGLSYLAPLGQAAAGYQTALVGGFNIYNALAAALTAGALQVASGQVREGLARVRGIPGRMERVDEGQAFTALVDFAHTPNALHNALSAARTMLQPGQRLIAVFGSAGLRDREKRRLMAETAARLADVTILTAEDPRTESLDSILEVMAAACLSQGGVEGETFFRVPDRGQALYRACQIAAPGDIVMACGKGHEQSMCFGTVEYPWDDRAALRAALRGAPLRTLPTAGA